MSIRTKLPRRARLGRPAARRSRSRAPRRSRTPRCVGLTEMFVWSSSAAIRRSTSSYVAGDLARAAAGSPTCSPSSVVFVRRPCSFRPRRVATTSSSVSPPTNRAAPSRMPYASTKPRTRGLPAAAEDRAAEDVSGGRSTASSIVVQPSALVVRQRPERRRGRPPGSARRGGRARASAPRDAGSGRSARAGAPASTVLAAHGGGDDLRERGRQRRDRPDRAGDHRPARSATLGPTKTSSPSIR